MIEMINCGRFSSVRLKCFFLTAICLQLAFCSIAAAGMADRAKNSGGALIYAHNGQTMRIEGWGRDSIRVQIIPDGGGKTSDWALDIPLHTESVITIGDRTAELRNGKISVVLSDVPLHDGLMEFFRCEGDQKISLFRQFNDDVIANNPGSRTFLPTDDGLNLFRAELAFEPDDAEHFFGMGENATRSHLDLKGCVIDLYQRHVKAVIPFVVSNKKYGFLWNNPSLGRVEFGMNKTRWISDGCRQMDFFVTTGENCAEIMSNYADATGHAPEFPEWAAGFWQCKLRYSTQEEFLRLAREFKKRGLPLSVLVIDFLHWKAIGDWQLDPKFWPDPKAMMDEMNEMGYRVMVSPWPLVNEASVNWKPMMDRGLFTTSVNHQCDKVFFGGQVWQYDPTNPEAAKYLWDRWKENYVDLGIKTFWLDSCDEFHEIKDYGKVLYHLGPAKECHAYYPVAHQKNIYEGLKAAGETEIISVCRNAWAGSQRYGACVAPHDINSSFEHMAEYMKAGLNVSMSGMPWWNCDIGGFHTHDYNSPEFKERMIRWYQLGVFMPIFRTHGNRPENEPWSFGEETLKYLRASMFLRENLRPYIMEQMKLASEKGIPVARPLFFDFESDKNAMAAEDELMFGPAILAAPILKMGQRTRDVYLPAGAEWIDVWTGEKIPGGQTIHAEAPLEHIPVFLRSDDAKLRDCFLGIYEK